VEYCEFQPSFAQCREKLVADMPTIFPDVKGEGAHGTRQSR